MIKRPRIFYGWYIVILTIITMALIYGVRHSFSVLFDPILDEFGWLRGETAVMLSLNVLIYGLTAPLAGSLVDRWKPMRVIMIGIVILTLATGLCYFASEPWHFYVLFGVFMPIGTSFCGTPVLNPALINWFGKRRGLAIGLGQIGGGLSFAYSFLVEAVISSWGWRPSFFVMAMTVLGVLTPLFLLFYHLHPEDRGDRPYGIDTTPQPDVDSVTVRAALADWTLGAALKTRYLWGFIAAQFFYWGIGNYLVIAHQVKFAVDSGYSGVLATSVFALFGIVSIAGQVAASMSDKIGREPTATIGVVLAITSIIALLNSPTHLWLLYAYAVCSGFATGLFTPQVFAGVADIFHGKNIGAIAATLLTGFGIGGTIGPWLGGFIYDVSGSYSIAFIISGAAYGVAGISLWLAAPRKAGELRARLN